MSHFVETLKDDIVTVNVTDMPVELQEAETAWYRDFWGVWKGAPEVYLRDALPLFQVSLLVPLRNGTSRGYFVGAKTSLFQRGRFESSFGGELGALLD